MSPKGAFRTSVYRMFTTPQGAIPLPLPRVNHRSRNRESKLFENRQAVGSNDRPRGCFFIIAPRLMTPNAAARPPIVVAILFPAIVFGIGAMVQYFRQQRP